MKIITVGNQKGGAGKTTTALNLAFGLQQKQKNVLAIDMDGQCNLSYLLGVPEQVLTESDSNIYSILSGKKHAADCILHTESDIDLIPASPALYEADMTINKVGKEYRLKKALESISDYDYIVIDTPPNLGIVTVNAFTASNSVLIPVQADILSLVGLNQLTETLQAVQEYTNPELKIDGILITRFNARARLSRDFRTAIEQQAEQIGTRVFHSEIRESVTIKEAQVSRQSLYAYDGKSKVAGDYMQFVEELEGV